MFYIHVHLFCSPDEAKDMASQMIGHQLHTKQTGTIGRPCEKASACVHRAT